MELDYKELAKEQLISIKQSLEYLDATVMRVPDLLNKLDTALDYLFYLEDTSHERKDNNDN